MSNKNKNKKAPVEQVETPNKVLMIFKEHKYYNDLNKPHFEAGKIYELEGAEWIQRWIKRGGEILEGTFKLPESDPENNSEIVQDAVVKDDKPEEVEQTFLDDAKSDLQ